jgi:hypothetical protein
MESLKRHKFLCEKMGERMAQGTHGGVAMSLRCVGLGLMVLILNLG